MPDITELAKIPPHNLEAEMSLLGSIMLDKDAMIKIADLIEPNDFYKKTNSDVFETMLELYAKNEPIDVLTLGNRLEEKNLLEKAGGRNFIVGLSNPLPSASHIK